MYLVNIRIKGVNTSLDKHSEVQFVLSAVFINTSEEVYQTKYIP